METLYLGDCLEEMKKIPDGSVDLVLTDPPYELGFMGKSWDSTGIANNVDVWKQCLRVLKPGGYLLSFGGTRTYHRMASAIEDAGFEVRDMIEWVYGCLSEDTEILTANGWKMLYSVFEGDYVFACDYKNDMKLQLEPVKQKFIYDYDEDAYHIKDIGYYNSELMETDHIVSKNHNVLVLESWVRNNGFGNDLYYEKIQAEKLYEYIKKTNGKKTFRIPGLNGDIPCTIEKIPYKGKVWCVEVESGAFVARRKGKIFITGNSGFPKSLNIGKAVDKLQGNEREYVKTIKKLAMSGDDINSNEGWSRPSHRNPDGTAKRTMDITKGTSEWEGWGTALKPAHEPICMARKPLAEKTVAENCLKYGTGGINIDESRVEYKNETAEDLNRGLVKQGARNSLNTYSGGNFCNNPSSLGRFPANLIHDNSEEVRECFPESKSQGNRKGEISDTKWGFMEYNRTGVAHIDYNDSGNASRFFKSIIYQAKASKSERNKGLDSIVLVDIIKLCNENNTTKEEKLIRLMVTGISPQKVIAEFGVQLKNANEWNTCLFGKHLMEKYQEDIKSITKTETNSITTSQTLNWLTHLLTNEYTVGVNLEMGNGGNLVENAVNSNTLIITINEAIALALGVKDVVSGMQLKINVKEGSNIHSTVKPIALMEYLINMVTREGQTVLDMFMGSGTTGVACKNLNRNFIGIEKEEEYFKIANARINKA